MGGHERDVGGNSFTVTRVVPQGTLVPLTGKLGHLGPI